MEKLGEITRREFIKITGLLAGGAAIASTPFLSGCGYPTAPEIDAGSFSADGETVTLMLDKIPELSQVGDSAAVKSGDDRIHLIIARTGADGFVVALNECPHREKPMGYDHEAGRFVCATGKSEFELDGTCISGPVESPLPVYPCRLEQDSLIIDLAHDSI